MSSNAAAAAATAAIAAAAAAADATAAHKPLEPERAYARELALTLQRLWSQERKGLQLSKIISNNTGAGGSVMTAGSAADTASASAAGARRGGVSTIQELSKDPIWRMYLGVLTEYKTLQLLFCDALWEVGASLKNLYMSQMQGTLNGGVGHHGYVHAHVPSADLINAAAALLPKGVEFADKLRGLYSDSRDHHQLSIPSIPGSNGSPGVRAPLYSTDNHPHNDIHSAHAHAQGQTRTVQFHHAAEGGRKEKGPGHGHDVLSQGQTPPHFLTGTLIYIMPCPAMSCVLYMLYFFMLHSMSYPYSPPNTSMRRMNFLNRPRCALDVIFNFNF